LCIEGGSSQSPSSDIAAQSATTKTAAISQPDPEDLPGLPPAQHILHHDESAVTTPIAEKTALPATAAILQEFLKNSHKVMFPLDAPLYLLQPCISLREYVYTFRSRHWYREGQLLLSDLRYIGVILVLAPFT